MLKGCPGQGLYGWGWGWSYIGLLKGLLLFLGNCLIEDSAPQTARTLEPSWSGSCSVGGSDEGGSSAQAECRAPTQTRASGLGT